MKTRYKEVKKTLSKDKEVPQLLTFVYVPLAICTNLCIPLLTILLYNQSFNGRKFSFSHDTSFLG